LCNNLVNFCDFHDYLKQYEVQYEENIKITETNEPQGVTKYLVKVNLLKGLLPNLVLLICYHLSETCSPQ